MTAMIRANRGGEIDLFWLGFANHAAGQALEQQATWQERNGWHWAQTRHVEQDAAAGPSDLEDDMEDREFWSRGQW